MLILRAETLRQKSMPNFETFCVCHSAELLPKASRASATTVLERYRTLRKKKRAARCRTAQLAHSRHSRFAFVPSRRDSKRDFRYGRTAKQALTKPQQCARGRCDECARSDPCRRSMAENPNPPHNPTGRPSKEAASPPKKYVRGPDDEIYKRKREKKPPKPPDLSKDLQQMMYGFGDAQEVDAESVEMVERLVRQYIDELLGEASAIASIRRCPLDSGCLLYAVRHDRLKFERARRLLEMKEVIRDARKKADEVEDVD